MKGEGREGGSAGVGWAGLNISELQEYVGYVRMYSLVIGSTPRSRTSGTFSDKTSLLDVP